MESSKQHELTEEAASWLVALDAGSADRDAFERWRSADIRHAVAFNEVAATWGSLDALRPLRGLQADDPRTLPVPQPLQRGFMTRRRFTGAGIAAGLAAVTVGGWSYNAFARRTVSTLIGERRSVRCFGSLSVDLNTDTRIAWRERDSIRKLWLRRGEAAMAVDASQPKPIDLITPSGRFILQPGLYNARLRAASCELTVLEGSGMIMPIRRVVLAGQTAVYTGSSLSIHDADPLSLDRIRAWRRGNIVLTGESLDYAVDEYNRYLSRKIIIADPGLSRMRLGGTFAITDLVGFLQAIRASFGIRAFTDASGSIILTRA